MNAIGLANLAQAVSDRLNGLMRSADRYAGMGISQSDAVIRILQDDANARQTFLHVLSEFETGVKDFLQAMSRGIQQ